MANFSFTLALIAAVCISLGTGVSVVVSPGNEIESLSDSVTIACVLDDEGGQLASIEAVSVYRGDDICAFARKSATDDGNMSSRDNYKLETSLKGNVTESSFALTIEKPKSGDGGDYTCRVTYINKEGKLGAVSASASLTVKKLDGNQLEKMIVDLKAKVDALKDGCSCNGDGSGVSAGGNVTSGVGGAVAPAVKTEEKQVSAFAVTNKVELRAKKGRVLVLPDVIMNHGPGYDVDTGIYTAPWDGLYVFHLSLALAGKASGTIVQLRKKEDVLFRLYAADKSYDDQSAASTVVFLKKDDTVNAFVEAASGTKLYDNRYYTVYSGYLLKVTPQAAAAAAAAQDEDSKLNP